MNKIFTLIIFAILIIFPKNCFAGVQISEIYYDPPGTDTGHEWIEIENDSDSEIDISGWKLFENNSNHTLTLIGGNAILPAHGFAVIADNSNIFSADWTQYSGTLFDSAFSLSNTGETLAIKDSAGAIINEVTYSSELGANGDGNTLNISGNSWYSAPATPGALNQSSGSNGNGDNGNGGNDNGGNGSGDSGTNGSGNNGNTNGNSNSSGNSSSGSAGSNSTSAKKEKKYSVKIVLENNTVLADSNVAFNSKIVDPEGLTTTRGNLFWNFGDGESIYLRSAETFVHAYTYPGRYVATLSYYENYYDFLPKATDRITITVKDASLEFTDDGLAIFLKNTSNSEIDISLCEISNSNSKFIFPKNTILLSGGYIILEKIRANLSPFGPYELRFPNTRLITDTKISKEELLPEIIEPEPKAIFPQKNEEKTLEGDAPEIDIEQNQLLETDIIVDLEFATSPKISELNDFEQTGLIAPEKENTKENTIQRKFSKKTILIFGAIVLTAISFGIIFSRKVNF